MITGYASVYYNARNKDRTQFLLGPGYVERFAKGAFDDFLRSGQDVVGLFNHDPSLVLGRLSSGTLEIEADSRGLFYRISPADTSVSRDVQAHQERGDVIGSSIGFRVEKESHTREGNMDVRTIEAASIRDVGPVTYPAYDGTADVRMVYTDGTAMALTEKVIAEARCCEGYKEYIQREIQVRARLIELSQQR